MADSRAPDTDRQTVRGLVSGHYPEIASRLLEPLFDVLRLGRAACGGDVDKALIILVVAIRSAEHPGFAAYTREQLESGAAPDLPSLGTNVRSIAESLGAPRETVRRKVRELIDAGWIGEDGQDGHKLRYTAHAAGELNDVRNAIEQMAIENFETVVSLVRRAGSETG